MSSYKIMNVLLADTPQFVAEPTLLCRSEKPWHHGDEEGAWLLEGPAEHDFMTFFNALSVAKWVAYTGCSKYYLHIEVKGAACKIQQTHAGTFDRSPVPVDEVQFALLPSESWQSVDFALLSSPDDVLLSFKVECEGDVFIRNSFYYVDEAPKRTVELALCTTTFKKEEFILRNIDLARKYILSSTDPVAEHFTMHVVDNGRSLDAAALSHGGVVIHPNNNVGGAGGFARGMIEASEQDPKATHVLLMDDDVLISPESIVRTFNLLSYLKPEYEDAFVAGAMMSMEEPAQLWEDKGFVKAAGYCGKEKPVMRMDVMHDVVARECFTSPLGLPDCDDQAQSYAAWWYCVIPMTQIDEHGLPLPIFVRLDDVEYGRRCKPHIIGLNGVCVWHMPFFMRYNASQECYQGPRNSLIDKYASDFAPLSDIDGYIRELFFTRLQRFAYMDAELVVRALEDFLKGPEWIMEPVAEKAFLDGCRESEKFFPIADMKDELAAVGVDFSGLTDWDIYRDMPVSRLDDLLFRKTVNGQRRQDVFTQKGKVSIIDAFNFDGGEGRFIKAETIVAVDVPNGRVAIRHRDRERFQDLFDRFMALTGQIRANDQALREKWSAAFPAMTSVEFWKGYLGI